MGGILLSKTPRVIFLGGDSYLSNSPRAIFSAVPGGRYSQNPLWVAICDHFNLGGYSGGGGVVLHEQFCGGGTLGAIWGGREGGYSK